MARLFVHRPRYHALWRSSERAEAHAVWELASGVLYTLGAVGFVVGSVFFFPALETRIDVGPWLFVIGSLCYLVVTSYDVAEVIRAFMRRGSGAHVPAREIVAAVGYFVGTVLFAAASICFLDGVERIELGAAGFVVGSLLFVLGAMINVLQIGAASSRSAMQLLNLTAATFLAGSVLFTTASMPYRWSWQSPSDESTIHAFLAAQFWVGSMLFLAGGLFNLTRAWRYARSRLGVSR